MQVAVDQTTIVIAVVVALALIAGVVANRWVRPHAKSEVQGIKLETMIGPIVSITVLLLAFTLVTVYGGYQRAQVAAQDEARKVDQLFDTAGYLRGEQRIGIQAATTCYALAVANYEWDAMAAGSVAPEVSPWPAMIGDGIAKTARSDSESSALLGAILTSDRERAETRSRRLSEAQPAVPDALKFFFLFCAAMAIFALGAFTLPYVRRRVQIGILVILATLFIMFMVLIKELDEPFYGLAVVPPTDITRVAGSLSEDFVESHPGVPLPCDNSGVQIQEAGPSG